MTKMGGWTFPCLLLLFGLLQGSAVSTKVNKRPNIIFILTDDQDVEIGGMTPITKTRKLIGDEGIVFDNMFATSPLCCPSRSSILTGNYVHNHGALNNSVDGNCSSPAWQHTMETKAFATYIKNQGYKTFFAGKYLNQYGKRKAGGVGHVPPGWDDWHGLVGNSVYYHYNLSINGKAEPHGDKYPDDYLTDLIGRRAEKFLKDSKLIFGEPFFMMLSTPACHAPFTPAPQYNASFSNQSAPRGNSFNTKGKDKHWLLRQVHTPMPNSSLEYIDATYKNRWRTLLTVDDIVENMVNILKDRDMLDNTYIVYTSDNGFHLGQFSLPNDKRQLYEFDIRVPLMVRGPGIQAGQKRKEIILNIDLAPTFVDLAGEKPPSDMDGQSFKHLLLTNKSDPDSWRIDFMVEHNGEYGDLVPECPKWNHQAVSNCFPDCVCEDAYNNTYHCVRTISQKHNLMYCEFMDTEGFVEVYDMNKDPHQLENIVKTIDPDILVDQNKRLVKLSVCAGPTCHAKVEPWPPMRDTVLRFEPRAKKMKRKEKTLTRTSYSYSDIMVGAAFGRLQL